jgi:hypothetical protein
MTARKQANDLDFNQHQATNLGAPDPGSSDAARISDVEAASTADRSRANHTGTQLANTISNFDATVRQNRLDQMAAPTNPVSFNGQLLTGVANPVSATDGVNKQTLDAAIAALTSGLTLKGTVRAVSMGNVNIASPGATIDGLTASSGQVFWLNGQTTSTQNGPYVFNGAAAAMTRATNWDTDAEAVLGSFWVVREGTSADSLAILSNDAPIVIGTSTPAVTIIKLGAGTSGYSTNVGNGAATAHTVVHSLGTEDVLVQVRRVASPKDFIDVYVKVVDGNTVSVEPDDVWATGEFRVMVRPV